MGSNSSGWFSNEEMLASIDPEKMYNMPGHKRFAARCALDWSLSRTIYSRCGIRSKFPGISYSDCKNLLVYATKYTRFPYAGAYNPFWMDMIGELQSMVEEFESSPKASKQINSEQIHFQFLESNGIGIGDDRIPFPIPVPRDEQISKGSYKNNGEQHLRGLINNQNGHVSGNGNGSYIVNVMKDCKFSLNRGNQIAD